MDGLASYLLEARAGPFVWGVSDCTTFACDWVRLRCGVDPLEPGRGRDKIRDRVVALAVKAKAARATGSSF